MKKILLSCLCIFTSLFILSGCGNSIEGGWICTAVTKNGKQDMYRDTDYIFFEKDGSGNFIFNLNVNTFNWQKKDDECTINMDFEEEDPIVSFVDEQLVLKYKTSTDKYVFYFDKLSEEKYELKKENDKKASYVYYAVYEAIDDYISSSKYNTPNLDYRTIYRTDIKELNKDDSFQSLVLKSFDFYGLTEGSVSWIIINNKIYYATYTSDSITGLYYNPYFYY